MIPLTLGLSQVKSNLEAKLRASALDGKIAENELKAEKLKADADSWFGEFQHFANGLKTEKGKAEIKPYSYSFSLKSDTSICVLLCVLGFAAR